MGSRSCGRKHWEDGPTGHVAVEMSADSCLASLACLTVDLCAIGSSFVNFPDPTKVVGRDKIALNSTNHAMMVRCLVSGVDLAPHACRHLSITLGTPPTRRDETKLRRGVEGCDACEA